MNVGDLAISKRDFTVGTITRVNCDFCGGSSGVVIRDSEGVERTSHESDIKVLEGFLNDARKEGWNKARDQVRGIPYWYTDKDHHGFDLWEDENGYAQESGARIMVMKILDNNPYSDSYVDPAKVRAKRRVEKIRRRMIEEGRDPNSD